MKRIFFTVVSTLILNLFAVGYSFAGYRQSSQVYVDSTHFRGSLGAVYNTTDRTQYIGCQDSGSIINCSARNTAGTYKHCATSDPRHLATFRGLTDSADIYVVFDSTGTCTAFISTTYSWTDPKR